MIINQYSRNMKKLFMSLLVGILFLSNLSAQVKLESVPNNNILDSTMLITEARVDRPRRDGDLRKIPLFIINGIVISEKEGNPCEYFSTNEIESLKVLKIVDDKIFDAICFITTKKGVRINKNIRKMIKNSGKAEYVIFNEKEKQ